MSKCTRSGGNELPQKQHCNIDLQGNQAVPSALVLEELDDTVKKYIPDPAENSSVGMPASRMDSTLSKSRVQKSHMISKAARKFIANQAKEDDKEDDKDEDSDGRSVWSLKAIHLPGLSAKERLAVAFDNMASRFEDNPSISSQDHQDHPIYRALQQGWMYLLHIQSALPPIPPLNTMTTKETEIKIGTPPEFNGDRDELHRFMLNCNTYLDINDKIYDNDKKKVIFALSFMTKGNAAAWKEDFMEAAQDPK
ncbi:hypothetical protein C8R48DRAFT_770362 [Suillus tomentosus]|nr:hypothetical protein C8R48DRAFT_770362 [Suillus tomentosus]